MRWVGVCWQSTCLRTKTGYLVNEVNYTMEFRNSIDTTGVNIPDKVIDFVVAAARKTA